MVVVEAAAVAVEVDRCVERRDEVVVGQCKGYKISPVEAHRMRHIPVDAAVGEEVVRKRCSLVAGSPEPVDYRLSLRLASPEIGVAAAVAADEVADSAVGSPAPVDEIQWDCHTSPVLVGYRC